MVTCTLPCLKTAVGAGPGSSSTLSTFIGLVASAERIWAVSGVGQITLTVPPSELSLVTAGASVGDGVSGGSLVRTGALGLVVLDADGRLLGCPGTVAIAVPATGWGTGPGEECEGGTEGETPG